MSKRKLITKVCVRRSLVILALTLAAVQVTSAQIPAPSPDQPDESLNQTNAILISKYMMLQGHEGLLITNPGEIRELVRLFRGNQKTGHACGYHWLMAFRQRPTVSVFRSHNEDCEIYYSHNAKINSLLKAYSTQIKSAPSHYIYNVKIPASFEPDEAARRLETGSQMVFFLTGAEQRLPQVRIQSTSISNTPNDRKWREQIDAENLRVAQRKLTTAIELLKSRYAVIKHTKLDNRYRRSGGGIIEDRVDYSLSRLRNKAGRR